MNTPPIICCRCCAGTGKIELPPDHWRTLQRLRASPAPLTTQELVEDGVSRNAINNRLSLMEEIGLIRRAGKEHKFILWEAVA